MKNLKINLTQQEQRLEDFGNSDIIYDAVSMPAISWEEGTGFFFDGKVNEKELINFRNANNIDAEFEQANIEAWIDRIVK